MKRYIAKAKIEEGICLEGTIIEVYFVETPSGNLIEFTDHQAEIAKRETLLIEAKDYLLKNHFDDAQAVLIAGKIVEMTGLFALAQKDRTE